MQKFQQISDEVSYHFEREKSELNFEKEVKQKKIIIKLYYNIVKSQKYSDIKAGVRGTAAATFPKYWKNILS